MKYGAIDPKLCTDAIPRAGDRVRHNDMYHEGTVTAVGIKVGSNDIRVKWDHLREIETWSSNCTLLERAPQVRETP